MVCEIAVATGFNTLTNTLNRVIDPDIDFPIMRAGEALAA